MCLNICWPFDTKLYYTFIFNTCLTTRWQCSEKYKPGKTKGTSFTWRIISIALNECLTHK